MAVVVYELGISTVAAATGAAYAEFQSNATRRASIYELDVFEQTAVAAGKTQLGRPGNTPTGGAVTVGGTGEPADTVAATAGVTTTWTAAPTAPSPAMAQFDFPATVGSAAYFVWPDNRPINIGLTRAGSFIIWNASGSTGPILSTRWQYSE